MVDFLSSRRFLAIYSGCLTVVFAVTVLTAFKTAGRSETFDELTVQRLNVVEPDGTPRMVLAAKARFPGLYYHGKDMARNDRSTAGIIFNNDEGTENGGLIFGGYKDAQGVPHGYGHLSFDRYDQDQVINIEQNEDGDQRTSGIAINDVGDYSITPEFMAEADHIKGMPHGQARADAWKAFKAKYPGDANRAYLGRVSDKSVGLILRDIKGRERLRLLVKADGTPVVEFLDETGKVVNKYSATSRAER
jgi:hypothetical protein